MEKIKPRSVVDPNICIRIDRDEQQISRCIDLIDQSSIELSGLAEVLQIAGNLVRLKILFLLLAENHLCVCDLSEILQMKVPAISQHLKKLKDTELVTSEKEGTTIYYRVNKKNEFVIRKMLRMAGHFMPG